MIFSFSRGRRCDKIKMETVEEVSQVKQYTYVTVTYSGVYQHKLQEHRKIIDQYAAEGWRYVDHIPVHQYARGEYGSIDLVFERDVEE